MLLFRVEAQVLLEAEGPAPSVKYTSRRCLLRSRRWAGMRSCLRVCGGMLEACRDNAFVQNGSLKIVAKCEVGDGEWHVAKHGTRQLQKRPADSRIWAAGTTLLPGGFSSSTI